MSNQVTGKVKLIGEIETFPSGFQKRSLVVETEEQYPQPISIEFFKDKTDLLNDLKVGQSVTVSINIRGNEYNGKYYTSLNGWRIDKGESSAPQKEQTPQESLQEESQDLPF